jgi:hypothetical protein
MAKKKTEFVALGRVKDWRDSDHELEILGIRMDYALARAKESKSDWAQSFWYTTFDRLFNKWTLTIKLKDAGMRQLLEPKEDLEKYDWWEPSEEVKLIGFNWFDEFYNNMGLQRGLEESWTKSKEIKLEKARQGLA